MTVVELKDLILDNFEVELLTLYHELNQISVGFESTDCTDYRTIKMVITGLEQSREKMGCHVYLESVADDFKIVESLETALMDGFDSVYIHLNYKVA